MGKRTGIEWADSTMNPWMGCSKVSSGCKNCYAEVFMECFNPHENYWGSGAPRKEMGEKYWGAPLKWNKDRWATCPACGWRGILRKAEARPVEVDGKMVVRPICPGCDNAGLVLTRQRVFCGSMCDVFEDHVDVEEIRARLLKLIVATPNLDWLLLTKRPENVLPLLDQAAQAAFGISGATFLAKSLNVQIGTSVENQAAADQRIPILAGLPAHRRFLSVEPLLGLVTLLPFFPFGEREAGEIHQVIAGGESGLHARPMNPAWAEHLRRDCAQHKIPFFFKQWGEWAPGREHHYPFGKAEVGEMTMEWQGQFTRMYRVGKSEAGRELHGRIHNGMPDTSDLIGWKNQLAVLAQ